MDYFSLLLKININGKSEVGRRSGSNIILTFSMAVQTLIIYLQSKQCFIPSYCHFWKLAVTEIQKLQLNVNSSDPIDTWSKFKGYKTFRGCPGMDKRKVQMNLNGKITTIT